MLISRLEKMFEFTFLFIMCFNFNRPLTSDKNWGLTLDISKENKSKQRIFFGVKVRQTQEKSLSLSFATGLYYRQE